MSDYFERVIKTRLGAEIAQARAARWSEFARGSSYHPELCQRIAAECYGHARALYDLYLAELKCHPRPKLAEREIKFNSWMQHYYPRTRIYLDGI